MLGAPFLRCALKRLAQLCSIVCALQRALSSVVRTLDAATLYRKCKVVYFRQFLIARNLRLFKSVEAAPTPPKQTKELRTPGRDWTLR